MAYSYAFLGDSDKAIGILSNLQSGFEKQGLRIKLRESYAQFAFVFAVLHNEKKFFEYLDKALSDGYSFKTWVEDTPEFDYLRNTTGYQVLKARYHLRK